jgi:hypothetical protein
MTEYKVSFSLKNQAEDIEDGVYDEMDEMSDDDLIDEDEVDDDILEEEGDEDY